MFSLHILTLVLSLIAPAYSANSKLEFQEALRNQGISEEAIAKISAKMTSVVAAETVTRNVEWLKNQGIKDAGSLILKFPPVLTYRIEENLNPKVEWLKAQGIQDIGKLLSAYPQILGSSIDENLSFKIEWLKAQGVKDIGKFLLMAPQVLSLSIGENLNPKVEWLKAQGVKDIGKFLSTAPALLRHSVENCLNPKIEWLKAQGVKDAGSLISKFPAVLTYSIEENLGPKLIHLKNHWDISIDDIERESPRFLGCALSRMSILAEGLTSLGFDLRSIDSVSKRIAIASMVSIDDVLENLKDAKIIEDSIQKISAISAEERARIKLLIEAGRFASFVKKSKKKACSELLGAPPETDSPSE